MPLAPGMFWMAMLGSPGRYLERKRAISRPDASVPPPGSEPISMVRVLPLKETCAAAAVAAACERLTMANAAMTALRSISGSRIRFMLVAIRAAGSRLLLSGLIVQAFHGELSLLLFLLGPGAE